MQLPGEDSIQVCTEKCSPPPGGQTAHLHLVSRLKVNGAVPLLPLYAFNACTETGLALLVFCYTTSSLRARSTAICVASVTGFALVNVSVYTVAYLVPRARCMHRRSDGVVAWPGILAGAKLLLLAAVG